MQPKIAPIESTCDTDKTKIVVSINWNKYDLIEEIESANESLNEWYARRNGFAVLNSENLENLRNR